MVVDLAHGDSGALYSGIRTDLDGETRYYENGIPTYAGLVKVGGDFYYFTSSKKAVRNGTYYVTKHNDLLPEGNYIFDVDGKMVNPPTATAQTAAASVMTTRATGSYQVWTPGTTTVYEYVYNGDKLRQMTVGSDMLNFSYDASGTPMTVQYNGTTYYYVTNVQGDVIAIVDASGTAQVEYAYDAWGKLLGTTGSLASTLGATNPLRYRGYTFDPEYEFYYLQSRYYDPEIGRFINADITVSTGQRFVGHNMFSYCINNPSNYVDNEGTDAVWIQEETNVGTMGHTGLLVENEDGDWYFFYWGIDSENINLPNIYSALKGTDAKIVWEEIETEGFDLTQTSGVIEALRNSNNSDVNRSNLITDTIYLEGDYTKTWQSLQELNADPTRYNLLTNNCVQQSNKALQKSNWMFAFTGAVIPNLAFMKAKVASKLESMLKNIM